MKICTITCHHAVNYGARLQACALVQYLKTLGHEAAVTDYRPDYMLCGDRLWFWPRFSVRQWAKLFWQFRRRYDAVRRCANFERFSATSIPRTPHIYYSIDDLRADPPQADSYIAGSDQIWNTAFRNGTDAAYYLAFGPKTTKRLSYAASFAQTALADGCESFVKEHLSRFDALSVRERSGVELLSSLGYDGRTDVDPVFLLSAGAWDRLLHCRDRDETYILVYDVMGCKRIKRIAKRLAGLNDCKIYAVGARRFGYADKNFSQAAPDHFVELVRNARCVVSNSFHGTAFAMIYHRDFFVIDRDDGLNERIHDLLAQYGLLSRRIDVQVSEEVLRTPVAYRVVESILQQRIARSKAFLTEILSR